MIVGKRPATPGVELALAADQQHRGTPGPCLGAGRQPGDERGANLRILDADDVALLQVALTGRAQRQRAQGGDQLRRHGAAQKGTAAAAGCEIVIASVSCMTSNPLSLCSLAHTSTPRLG